MKKLFILLSIGLALSSCKKDEPCYTFTAVTDSSKKYVVCPDNKWYKDVSSLINYSDPYHPKFKGLLIKPYYPTDTTEYECKF